MASLLLLHPLDNVALAVCDVAAGAQESIAGRQVTALETVRRGHKLALSRIEPGQPIVKYGQTIGFASRMIEPGSWVHCHNVEAGAFARDYALAAERPPRPEPLTGYAFAGYRRADGRVGTRNYVAVVSTVNCSASVARFVAHRFASEGLARFPHVDGVFAVTHRTGCGLPYDGPAHAVLDRVLGGYVRHPNVAACVLIGLGCETATLGHLLGSQGLVQISGLRESTSAPPRLKVLSMQDKGGTSATVEAAVEAIVEMLPRVDACRRESVPAAELVLGTNCGGSDGYSGVTANPALGVASDLLVAAGGTSVLGETPEIYGAEHLLTRRAVDRRVGEKLLARIRWWEDYTGRHGVEIDNNPSPGNKEGGLTTIYEKSLGAVAKGGTSALADVVEYAAPVRAKGLVVMDTPGFDPVSVTGIVAGGAQVMAFTTGRGSCFGCKPTPTIKIATNSPLYERMEGDMDLDAGLILTGAPVAEVGRQIFDLVLEVAGGRRTKSEQLGVGDEEFAPWILGPTL